MTTQSGFSDISSHEIRYYYFMKTNDTLKINLQTISNETNYKTISLQQIPSYSYHKSLLGYLVLLQSENVDTYAYKNQGNHILSCGGDGAALIYASYKFTIVRFNSSALKAVCKFSCWRAGRSSDSKDHVTSAWRFCH